jgi:hypothetical protein
MPTNRKTMPTTFAEIATALGNRTSITLCHNTVAVDRRNEYGLIAIKLHGHTICELFPTGTAYVTDCGYVTTTTYDRLKRFVSPLGCSVFRRNGTGYIRRADGSTAVVGYVGTGTVA